MSLSMHQASVPVFLRALDNLHVVLVKGAAHAKSKNVSDAVMLSTRLIPDMYPLSRQVQIACDIACRGAARLAGAEPRSFPDTEQTFDELLARIGSAKSYIRSFAAADINDSEERQITFKTGGRECTFRGQDFLCHFVLPNVFFHCTTAYNILREAGAALGKADFIGPQP